MGTERIHFQLEPGTLIQEEGGFFEKGHPEYMSDFRFYPVKKNDILYNTDPMWEFAVSFYTEQVEERLIYTYCYQEEENWARYAGKKEKRKWFNKNWRVEENGWIRLSVRRKDLKVLTKEDRQSAEMALYLECAEKEEEKKYYVKEIQKTVDTVRNLRDDACLVLGLMTDSHYVINGKWEESMENLRAVSDKTGFDAMIHLGDLTDGMVPLEITKEYAGKVMDDLRSLGVPLYLTLGNHDSNYFHGNPEWMTREEQSRFYLGRETPWYYQDFEKQGLRCLFLYSFDHREKVRYGFPMEEVEWVEKILGETPEGNGVLVFSHVPLLPEMHYWSSEIRNSGEMLNVLEKYVNSGGRILGYIHGHNHADQINLTYQFPIISIGCAKCEDFKDKKPRDSITYDRKRGTVTQELWDILLVNMRKNCLDFVGFGAGEDRRIEV